MELSHAFWIQIIIQFIFLAFFAGVIWTKLGYMEKKQDKHHKLIVRMFNVEQETDEAHNRIDRIEQEIGGD